MLLTPPKGKTWSAWVAVGLWSLLIFLTIPLARKISELVSAQWGRSLFTYLVLLTIGVALLAVIGQVIRHRLSLSAQRLLWLVLIAGTFTGYTLLLGKRSPEESVHFIQYGVLSVLVYRALTIKRRDISVYFSAAVICGIIGTVDEFIQWLVPDRHWDLRDIGINLFAAAMVQIAIAKGVQPPYIDRHPYPDNLRFLWRLMVIAAIALGASMFNTPERIAWYAQRLPGLGYLIQNESVMVEYGYRYEDSDIGIFRSRLAPDDLKRVDRERAVEAAEILNRYGKRSDYRVFLKRYTPLNDPFVHEARVHLYSRDVNFSRAMEKKAKSDSVAENFSKAYRYNLILEKYFTHTLGASDHVWPVEKKTLARQYLDEDEVFESYVSRHLITRISETQMMTFFGVLVLVFFMMSRRHKHP